MDRVIRVRVRVRIRIIVRVAQAPSKYIYTYIYKSSLVTSCDDYIILYFPSRRAKAEIYRCP